ncbi:MAG: hypothetical protein NTV98_05215 [Candidatus Roizmanbacteria bacterium]|nr:hypothetical protein [Candidatus Roizmanbacteria bacterium]
MEDKNKETKLKCIEMIEQNPVVAFVCHKCGIGRSTLYRWKQEDKEFAKKFDEAFQLGREKINDMAESGLIENIKDRDNTAIIYWLKHNNPLYKVGGLKLSEEDKVLIQAKISAFPVSDDMKLLFAELFKGQINDSVLKVLISLIDIGLKDRNLAVKQGKIIDKKLEEERKVSYEKHIEEIKEKYR